MNNFLKNLTPLLEEKKVELVIVSKTQPIEKIEALYAQGFKNFGENRVQELLEKYEKMDKNIQWHQIGHLQRNKVKYIAPFVYLIHSIDSWDLLEEVNKQGEKNNRCISVLLQFHVAEEETKHGFAWEDCRKMLENKDWRALKYVQICGIMGMASFSDNESQVKQEFDLLYNYFLELKERYFVDEPNFKWRSMGMSGDYPLAIEAGSNLLRIGTKCFAED